MRNEQIATIFARPHMPIMSFHALSLEPIPDVSDAISNLLPPGLTLLSGPPHCGKTSFALQLMHAVATGELLFGEDRRFQPSQGRVLYLGLQHSKLTLHLLQRRLAAAHQEIQVPETLECTNTWAALTLDEGLRDLEDWLTTYAETCRLLVIDNLDALRSLFRGKDRDLLALLRRLAERHDMSVLLVHTCKISSPLIDYAEHHLRLKPLSLPDYCQLDVSGTSLHRESYLFHASPEQVAFRLLGAEEMLALDTLSAHKVLTRERLDVLRLFHERGGILSPAEVAEALGDDSVNVRQRLHGMVRARLLHSPAYGRYEVHPDLCSFLPHLLERMQAQDAEGTEAVSEPQPEPKSNSADAIAHTSVSRGKRSVPVSTHMNTARDDAQEKGTSPLNRAQRRLQKQKKRH